MLFLKGKEQEWEKCVCMVCGKFLLVCNYCHIPKQSSLLVPAEEQSAAILTILNLMPVPQISACFLADCVMSRQI